MKKYLLLLTASLSLTVAHGQTSVYHPFPAWGTTAGFLAGFGFSALIFSVVALFEQRSWKYILINGGYIIVYFTIIGFIIGAWR